MRRVFVEEIRFLVLLIIAEFFFPQNTAPARTRVLIPVEHAAEEQEHIHYLNAGSSISVPLDPVVGSACTVTDAIASCRYDVDEMDAELSARFLSIIFPSAKLTGKSAGTGTPESHFEEISQWRDNRRGGVRTRGATARACGGGGHTR